MSSPDEVQIKQSIEEQEASSESVDKPAVESSAGMEEEASIQEIEDIEENESNKDELSFVEGIDSVQIASPSLGQSNDSDINPMLCIQLGDHMIIESKYGKIIGTVYYRTEELIRIKPDSVSNRLYDFPMNKTEEGEEFDESSEVTGGYIIEKRRKESFVEQNDIRVNQEIRTFDKEGNLFQRYQITNVDVNNDTFSIKIPEEDDEIIECNFEGIPLDTPFVIMEKIASDVSSPNDELEPEEIQTDALEQESEEDLVEPDEEDEEMIQVEGTIQVTLPTVYEEAESYEQKIPDDMQRISALNDFIQGIDPSLQKDPYALRSIRILVDTLYHLQKSSMKYTSRGELDGTSESYVTTMLDLIERSIIPLGRPVLRVSKKFYSYGIDEQKESDENIFQDFDEELSRMTTKSSKLVSSVVESSTKALNKEWNDIRSYLEEYGSPWNRLDNSSNAWKALSDTDFFRMSAPESIDNPTQFTLPGYTPSDSKEQYPIFYRVPFGLERALSITYRKGKDRRKETWIPEDRASLKSYIFFPLSTANAMGVTRSYSLAVDSGRSQLVPKTMKTILREVGVPKEEGNTDDVILINTMGDNTAGDIPIVAYINGLTIPSLGVGDAIPVLAQYGMDRMEISEEIYSVLQTKIKTYQRQLISVLGGLRKELEKTQPIIPEDNPLLIEPAWLQSMNGQPALAEELKEYERTNMSLASSDIGKASYLMKTHPIYFQVAAGKDSKQTLLAYHNAIRNQYFEQLRIGYIKNKQEYESGIHPIKNSCKHVSDLVSIRKIRNDTERFQELIRVFRRYQGVTEQNWINCNECKGHFICLHERLQLRAFMNPKEKDSIEKDLILSFSGGQFQGKYICRNCGQAMRELDFDKHMEFDSNGRPISGNAALIDEDALFDENFESALDPILEPSIKDELNLKGDEELYFNIIRRIANDTGIVLDSTGYQNVIRPMSKKISKFSSEDDYNARISTAPSKYAPYQEARAREIITAASVYLLLEVQTRIPSYRIQQTQIGCDSPGFGGFPLEMDETQLQGIKYLACAISSIDMDEYPWTDAFQTISDESSRRNRIEMYILTMTRNSLKLDTVQMQLSQKRISLEQSRKDSSYHDETGAVKDLIPSSFLPEQLILSKDAAAMDVIQPDVVEKMGKEGERALARLWIRQAHQTARETAMVLRGSPYAETTCCMNKLNEPGIFWKDRSELPPTPFRAITLNQQGSFLLTHFQPREMEQTVTEANKDLYYRLFLKYCFKGERIGYLHQPGLTNICLWCGLSFPVHPSVMDIDKEGRGALVDVDTNTEAFNDLLDTIHTVNHVDSKKLLIPSHVKEVMIQMANIEQPPIMDWKNHITTIMTDLSKRIVRPGATLETERHEISSIVGNLSNTVSEYKDKLTRMKYITAHIPKLDYIASLSWSDFFKVIQSYFMVPFQRMVVNFSSESLVVPNELKVDLSKDHVTKYLEPILKKEIHFLQVNQNKLYDGDGIKMSFAHAKMRYFISQLSMLLPFMNKIRPSQIPGKDMLLKYIQRAILYGPIYTLLDASHYPENSFPQGSSDKSIRFLMDYVSYQLQKYDLEKLAYDDAKIKNRIAVRDEKERVSIIKRFDSLSEEERQVELINKRLGLGDWARGGKKAIYSYDKEHFDFEDRQRHEMGISNFPGIDSDDGQGNHDYAFYDDEERGYDHVQLDADDA